MFCFEAENQKVSIKMIKHSGTSLHVLAIDEEPFPTKHFLAIDHAPFPYCGLVKRPQVKRLQVIFIGFFILPRQINVFVQNKKKVSRNETQSNTNTNTNTNTLVLHRCSSPDKAFPCHRSCAIPILRCFFLTFWTDLLCGFVKWPRPIKKRTQTERTNSHTWLYIQQFECQTSYYQQCPDILRSDSSKNHHICDQRSLSQLSKTCLHNDLQEHWSQRV